MAKVADGSNSSLRINFERVSLWRDSNLVPSTSGILPLKHLEEYVYLPLLCGFKGFLRLDWNLKSCVRSAQR